MLSDHTTFEALAQGAPLEGAGPPQHLVPFYDREHGGTVDAQSDGPGKGTAMTVRLPAAAAQGEGAADAQLGSWAVPVEKRRRVLIVDDNEDAVEMLAEILRSFGHEVVAAHDGPQALATIAAAPPHVAILDLGLPVMDGFELAERIRQALGPAAPRLIALTGYGQAQDRERTSRAGFARHLVKPVEAEDLVAAIEG